MSLQRRLLLALLVCAPVVWAAAAAFSVWQARTEVNELFDAELIRLARQVQALSLDAAGPLRVPPVDRGEADLNDLAVAVWDGAGRAVLVDREGAQLRWRPTATGFVDETLDGDAWRVYYLQSSDGRRLVAAGQKVYERDELVWGLTLGQLLPWLLVLPVLLAAMAWAVRQALAPMHRLSGQLALRRADDLTPVQAPGAPTELQPLLEALNGLLARTAVLLERERRFTADAAHELRTPLAALRAQWDVLQGAGPGERAQAQARLEAGFERLDRLVAQLLALSRAEAAEDAMQPRPVDWPALAEQVLGDSLPLADRRRMELACQWPPAGTAPFPLQGDPALLAVLLRNLVDNAVRYGAQGGVVTLRFEADALEVANDGEPVPPEVLESLGERFARPAGQAESGSGLGISIARRIAQLHGLQLTHRPGTGGRGLVARLARG